MYNVRYHLASLISVFFALAIGLLLGGLIAEQSPVNVQEAVLQGIERDIALTRESNAQLLAENVIAYDFSDMLLVHYVNGRLMDYTVLVVGIDGHDVNSTIADLEGAGARTVRVTPVFNVEDSDQWQFQSDEDLDGLEYQAVINVYNPVSMADANGQDTAASLNGVLLERYFTYLAELGEAHDVPVIFAAIDNEEDSLIDDAWAAGFSGTNQLGNRYGSYSLVVLISSDTVGMFGTMDGAVALYPDVPDDPVPDDEPDNSEDEDSDSDADDSDADNSEEDA
ncbi:MAG: copper transporter [Coriobacteriia bacterium]|nr:copper transporter [Coriobacteriia bacterium]